MKKPRLAIVGAGGYGDYCLGLLERFVDPESYELAAAIDPYYEKAPRLEKLRAAGVKLFRDLEDFYAADGCDLLLIASPVYLHRQQCLTAFSHGSHVLCEKPLAPTVQEAREIGEAAERAGVRLGVGFQMSFCKPIQDLKRDILAGALGRPLMLKSYVSWQRYDSYYQSPWKGRLRGRDGDLVLDSVITNATAHYLHNTCFVLGRDMESASLPAELWAELYNGKGIESFDTAFLRGRFADGCGFFLAVTHSGDRNIDPVLRYEFENAVVTASGNDDSAEIVAAFRDGSRKNYGAALGEYHVAEKIRSMLAVAADPGRTVACTASTILPQLTVCNALFEQCDVYPLPAERMEQVTEPEPGRFMTGLADEAWRCFEEARLPSECGLPWARPAQEVRLAGYTAFSRPKCERGAGQ